MFNLSFLALVATMLVASVAEAQGTSVDQTYLDFQVQRPVRIKEASSPIYPDRLRNARINGEVLVQFVVNEKGEPEMSTFKIVKSTDNLFNESVRRSVVGSTFHAAEIDGRRVKQLVQLPYKFNARK